MIEGQLFSGAVALGLGAVVGLVLFVPFVAISYRRRGGLSLGRFVIWGAALVYFWAIWTYTLLPLPDGVDYSCVAPQLNLGAFVDDIRGAIGRGHPLTDFALLQLVLNVLLFLPLGFFLRVLTGRGIVVALLVGFGLSLFIETTQLTGVWRLYPCAYRTFDVDDMLTNTIGAVLGSLLSLAVPLRYRRTGVDPEADLPRPVTRSRRLIAMMCDLLALWLTQFALAIGIQLWFEYVLGDHQSVLDGHAGWTSAVIVAVLWLVVALATGRTIGDLAVQLRYVGGPLPRWLASILRYLGGIGGFAIIAALPFANGLISLAFVLLSLVLVFATRGARGLPGLASGQRVIDARERP